MKTIPNLRASLGSLLIILDIVNIGSAGDDLAEVQQNFSRFKGIDGIMTLGNYDDLERVRKEAQVLQGRLYYVIDSLSESWNRNFSDEQRMVFAKEVIRCNCRGLVMSTGNLERIRKFRETLGEKITILAKKDDQSRLGDGINAGANYEILVSGYWNSREVKAEIVSFKNQSLSN